MGVTKSAEDYLETILILSKRLPVVRSVDIANEIGYKKSSVSIAMRNLEYTNRIVFSNEGYITLTDEGMEIAQGILEKHEFFLNWFMGMSIPERTAREDACKIEHSLSEDTFEAIKEYVKNNSNPENTI